MSWGGIIKCAIPFNKGLMGDSAHCLLWDQNLGLTPRRESRLQRVMGDLLNLQESIAVADLGGIQGCVRTPFEPLLFIIHKLLVLL